jgi:hypothetical protein
LQTSSAEEPSTELGLRFSPRVFSTKENFSFRPKYFLLLALAILAINAAPAMAGENDVKCPPATRVDDVRETIHGVVVSDPYRWLEDQNSPETRAWIDAQNACTQIVLKALPGSQAIAKRWGN